VDATSGVFDPMSDGHRDQLRTRHSEFALGLAGLARRDRDAPVGLLPADERRAVVVGLFGVILSTPEGPNEHPAKHSGFYVGNLDPSAPRPPAFELYPGWCPAESETLRRDEDWANAQECQVSVHST
jgi:hypothetical protein